MRPKATSSRGRSLALGDRLAVSLATAKRLPTHGVSCQVKGKLRLLQTMKSKRVPGHHHSTPFLGVNINKSHKDKNTILGDNKANEKFSSVANNKTSNSKSAHASSLQTHVSFNSHKRRRPFSLQNSPVDPRNEKNNIIQPLPPAPVQEAKVLVECHVGTSLQGPCTETSPSASAQADLLSKTDLHVEPAENGGVSSSYSVHTGGGKTAGL
ncbi:hypothetical protein PIB30_039330 [Stylosanthes scabra]|uniref:Uncharacterized protein n=1 Tax=Stylosanthes scabra TaxID=79078 RepID=A0ABU6SEJ8_9FABA|nr:hypothetical protein [Stylosanthes scabra]